MNDVKHIEMNIKTANKMLSKEMKFENGMYFTADELMEKGMVTCASTGILINDDVECDYLVVLTDGGLEEGYFFE